MDHHRKSELNTHTIKSMIIKAWNMQSGLKIVEVRENTFSFCFEREEDYARILKDRPWMILCFLLVLERWGQFLTLNEVDLNYSPCWIQLDGLPLEGFIVKNVMCMGSKFGRAIT